jgi:hypothetical protein
MCDGNVDLILSDPMKSEDFMTSFFEQFFSYVWNRMVAKPAHPTSPNSLSRGFQVIDGRPTDNRVIIPQGKRTEHLSQTRSGLHRRSPAAKAGDRFNLVCVNILENVLSSVES